MPPPIIDLVSSSDCRFRDIVGRDQSQVATSGNLIRKSHHRISAGQYNAWTTRTTNNLQYRDVTYANNVFVAVAASASSMTSSDGMTWTLHSGPSGSWQGIAYGNGLFVSVSSTGSTYRVRTSPDGSTWTTQTSPVDGDWISVTYGDGLFVAVANTGNSRIMTSPDGQNWTTRTAPAAHSWYDVAYGNGLFVAVSTSGTGDRVMTSPDGITWTLRSTPADNGWTSVTYGNGLFVAVAWTGTGDGVMTSPDGIVWTLRTSAADNAWRGVGYGAGLFVAVSFTGVGNRVMTSPDGIVWTSRTSPADNPWSAVAFGNGMFVAVASSGDNDRAMSSPWDAGVVYLSAAEVVSVAANNAQFDFLVNTPTAPLALADITTANIATWSGNNSILSLRRDTTTFRSPNVSVVGDLTANSITGSFILAPGGEARLDNCIIRSFAKTLGGTVGNASDICTIQNTYGAYTMKLNVVQSEGGASVAKTYLFAVRDHATANAWRRLIPITSTSSTAWGVEIRVNTTTTTLRLVRISGSTTTNIECTLTVFQSRADPVVISASATANTGVTFASTLYESSLLTQVGGNVGIGTDNPTALLTVQGSVNTNSLVAANAIVGSTVRAPGNFSNATVLDQGAYMSWNHNVGGGYTDFICKRGLGSGGFQFYTSANDGTAFSDGKSQSLANITSSGIFMTQGTFSAPGSIVGGLFLNGTSGLGLAGGVTISPLAINRTTHNTIWQTVATINYTPKSTSSRLCIHFDIDYVISGSGKDAVSSRLFVDNLTSSIMFKTQAFRTVQGSGTRSPTIFPISNVVKNTALTSRQILIQVYVGATDDQLNVSPNNWNFELLERQT